MTSRSNDAGRVNRPERTDRSQRYGNAPSGFDSQQHGLNLGNKALVLVFIAMVAAAAFYGVRYFTQQEKVNAKISYVSHEVLDDHTLRVWADVTRTRPDETAYCIIQAFDYDKFEVGRREIALAADGQEALRISVDIPTSARAVAGGVYGCSGLMPPYLDTTNPDYSAG